MTGAPTRGHGLKLFAVIDHSGEARTAGLELRDTKVVIFGNPDAGPPVMTGTGRPHAHPGSRVEPSREHGPGHGSG